MKHQKLMIIDGNALLHRAWHAIPPSMQTKEGKPINAAYGFLSIFLKALKDLNPEFVAVTFDLKGPTFRHEKSMDYKAQRVSQPDELYDQIPIIKEVIESLKIPIFTKKGYEADDVIGTICKNKDVRSKKIETIIVTGDKDTFQLIEDGIKVYTLKKGITDTVIYDTEAVKERFRLTPMQLVDMKALAGDSSDNIKGVAGIGIKTATDLILDFGNIENIYQELEKDVLETKMLSYTPRIRKLLTDHKEDAFLSKDLVTIHTDIDLEFNIADCALQPLDMNKVFPIFQKYEFRSQLKKLSEIKFPDTQTDLFARSTDTLKPAEEIIDYNLIDNQKDFLDFLEKISKVKEFAFDTETTGLRCVDSNLVGMSFSWKEKQAYYIHFGLNGNSIPDEKKKWLSDLKEIFENKDIKKFGHNIKFDIEVLANIGIEVNSISFDTMVASYLLSSGSRAHKLADLVFSEFGQKKLSYKELMDQYKEMEQIGELSPEEIYEYACSDADYCFRLKDILEKRLDEHKELKLFRDIELPLISILASIEMNGILLDVEFLRKMSQKAQKDVDKLEVEIRNLAGEKFNIKSQKQLKVILFEKLKIESEGLKKLKTGISIAAGELDKIQDKHPIVPLILKYRELTKLVSTYLDALPELVSLKTGRLHASFNQTVTVTGRLSSSDPNLQNIPVRTDLGREVRKAFIARKGYKILAADYSQIELRLAASLSGDKGMIKAFKEGKDIHAQTASEIYDVPLEDVTKEMRYHAKAINFGTIYGQGPYALALTTGLSYKEAKEFIDKYFQIRGGLKQYMEDTKQFAKEKGYGETLYGRTRYLPDINSNVPVLRASAERMAVNMPLQGTSADIIKIAMIKIHDYIKKTYKKDEILMLLQVHDELVFEVKENFVEEFAEELKELMEDPGPVRLDVPIEVDVEVGDNWGEMTALRD